MTPLQRIAHYRFGFGLPHDGETDYTPYQAEVIKLLREIAANTAR